MANGIVVDIAELIALKRFVYKPKSKPALGAMRSGNHFSKFRGRGMDFAEVRNYQAGDEIRHMEWRVTARTGRPHVKVYQEERERPVVIMTDFNPSMYFGTRVAFKYVLAARLAAMIALTAVRQGDRVGGLIASAEKHDEFTPRSREKGILPWLAKLCDYSRPIQHPSLRPARVLSDSLMRLRRVVHPGSIVVVISDLYQLDSHCEKQLSFLSAHNDVLIYHVCDPLELGPPSPDIYAMTNGRDEMLLDTSLHAVREDYQRFCGGRQEAARALCQRTQTQYVLITGDDNIPQLVRQTFPRRTYVG
jgi:uncharacterized protein (DUF58 family)